MCTKMCNKPRWGKKRGAGRGDGEGGGGVGQNLRSQNYQGRKSELCVLGIELVQQLVKQLVHFQDAAGLTAVNKARLTNCYLVFVPVVLTCSDF